MNAYLVTATMRDGARRTTTIWEQTLARATRAAQRLFLTAESIEVFGPVGDPR